MSDEGPRRISDKEIQLDLRGHLIPFENMQPVLLAIVGSTDLFVPIFSTRDKLEASAKEIGFSFDATKQISNTREFVESVIPTHRIAVNPYKTAEGKVRYVEPISFGARA